MGTVAFGWPFLFSATLALTGCATVEKPTMSCQPLKEFFAYLEQTPRASIADIEQQARERFPADGVENRAGRFVLIDFKTSLPCLAEMTAQWGAPKSIHPPPSPPPLGPNQGPIRFSSIEENRFHWSSRKYVQSGRTIILGTDSERIKFVRVDATASAD